MKALLRVVTILLVALLVAAIGVCLAWLLAGPRPAHAAVPALVTFEQGDGCEIMQGWDVSAAPLAPGSDPQAPTAWLGYVPHLPTEPCAAGVPTRFIRTISLPEIGSARVWLRGVYGTQRTGYSNGVDVLLAASSTPTTTSTPAATSTTTTTLRLVLPPFLVTVSPLPPGPQP